MEGSHSLPGEVPMRFRGLILLAVPVAGMALLATALLLRRAPDFRLCAAPSAPGTQPKAEPHFRSSLLPPRSSVPIVPRPDALSIARATEEARIESTYQNYRTALATEDESLSEALLPVLTADRSVA